MEWYSYFMKLVNEESWKEEVEEKVEEKEEDEQKLEVEVTKEEDRIKRCEN